MNFNNHKSSVARYGKEQRGMPGKQLYAHIFELGHNEIDNMLLKIMDKAGVNEQTRRKEFSARKFKSFFPEGLNPRDIS